MNKIFGTSARRPSHELAKRFRRAAAASSILAFGVGFIGPSGLALLGTSGLAIGVSTPAHADCLFQGSIRHDIPDSSCLEAQRTGCVRSMLTPDQYKSCLSDNKGALKQGKICVVSGVVRNDLSADDCVEANATGCVQRLLTPAQYQSCLDAQPKVSTNTGNNDNNNGSSNSSRRRR